jgi:energy-coupling factor transport system ATP-binding protein
VIEIRDLSFSYLADHPVLHGIDLDLRPGEHVSVLGRNGSGKSTFLRCIAGLLQPTNGTINHVDAAIASIGFVFQNPDDQIVSPLVESEIAFGLENLGMARDEMINRVDSALRRFDLEKYKRSDPHALSGGERQRLAIASIFVMRPSYLLFDEPYSMLDPTFRDDLRELIASLNNDGVTPIVVSQDPDTALEADRLVVIEDGRIAHDGDPAQILSDPDSLASGLSSTTTGRVSAALGFVPPVPTSLDELVALAPLPAPRINPPNSRDYSDETVVEIRDLHFAYDPGLPTEHLVLKGVDLTIRSGETISIMGPSGSGKSTLALHLNGLYTPGSGVVRVAGLDVSDTKTHDHLRQQVGLVFQFPETQLFAETVREDIAYGPSNLEMDNIEGRVESALIRVGLTPSRYLDRSPFTLSGGEKRRVALAGVLATSPEVLVLDEPIAGLDPAGSDDLVGILNELSKAGTTLIVMTHDLARAAATSDRIVGIVDGKIVVDQSPGVFLDDPAHLEALGIPVPPAIDLIRRLRTAGMAIPEGIHTSDQLIEQLAS